MDTETGDKQAGDGGGGGAAAAGHRKQSTQKKNHNKQPVSKATAALLATLVLATCCAASLTGAQETPPSPPPPTTTTTTTTRTTAQHDNKASLMGLSDTRDKQKVSSGQQTAGQRRRQARSSAQISWFKKASQEQQAGTNNNDDDVNNNNNNNNSNSNSNSNSNEQTSKLAGSLQRAASSSQASKQKKPTGSQDISCDELYRIVSAKKKPPTRKSSGFGTAFGRSPDESPAPPPSELTISDRHKLPASDNKETLISAAHLQAAASCFSQHFNGTKLLHQLTDDDAEAGSKFNVKIALDRTDLRQLAGDNNSSDDDDNDDAADDGDADETTTTTTTGASDKQAYSRRQVRSAQTQHLHFGAKLTTALMAILCTIVVSATISDLNGRDKTRQPTSTATKTATVTDQQRPFCMAISEQQHLKAPICHLKTTFKRLNSRLSWHKLGIEKRRPQHKLSSYYEQNLNELLVATISQEMDKTQRQSRHENPNSPTPSEPRNATPDSSDCSNGTQCRLMSRAEPSGRNQRSQPLREDSSKQTQSFYPQQQQQHLKPEPPGWGAFLVEIYLTFSLFRSAALIFSPNSKPAGSEGATGGDTQGGRRLASLSACFQSRPASKTIHSGSQTAAPTTNGQIFNTNSLHGLRFLSMIWVIVMHSYSFALNWLSFTDESIPRNIYKTITGQFLFNGSFACDTFLLVAGFLVTYTTFSSRQTATPAPTGAGGSQPTSSIIRCPKSKQRFFSSSTDLFQATTTTSAAWPRANMQPATGARLLVETQNLQPARKQVRVHSDKTNESVISSGENQNEHTRSSSEPSIANLEKQDSKASHHLEQQQQANPNQDTACLVQHHLQQQQQLHLRQLSSYHLGGSPSSCCSKTTSTPGSQSSMNEMKCSKILANLLHRYVRMTPLMMAIIGLNSNLLRYFGEGENWESSTMMFDQWCRNNWWLNMLSLHNFYDTDHMCLSHSWYSAVDLQLFLVGQILLLILCKSKKVGISLCVLLILMGQFFTGIQTYVYNLPTIPLLANFSMESMNFYYAEIYIKPYARAAPYLIGMILSYLMTTKSQSISAKIKQQEGGEEQHQQVETLNEQQQQQVPRFGFKTNYRQVQLVKLSKLQVILGWCSALATMTFIVIASQPAMNGQKPNEIQLALYGTLSRPLWAISIGWIIFACMTNNGGLLGKFLSARFFIPFSRLNYPVFLIHPVLIAVFYGSQQGSFHFSHYLMIYLILGNIVISYASAFILSALFELPILSIERAVKRFLATRREAKSTTTGINNTSNKARYHHHHHHHHHLEHQRKQTVG